MTEKEKDISSDYDSGWKEVLEEYFEDFLGFYFPRIHRDIDFSRPVKFLDTQFRTMVKESEQKKRRKEILKKTPLIRKKR